MISSCLQFLVQPIPLGLQQKNLIPVIFFGFCKIRTTTATLASVHIIMMNFDVTFESGRKEGNVLFNDALNTFYLRLYGVGHMVKDHSDSERGNPLPTHRLLFTINSKGSFICTIPQTG